jgi:DNA-binding NtrC family response regulator
MLLENQHILIVEDEFLIALDLEETVREAGAQPVGPVGTVREALALLEQQTVSGAILDINLGSELSTAIAEQLQQRKVPFIYHTGQSDLLADPAWPKAPVVSKPAMPAGLVAALAETISR